MLSWLKFKLPIWTGTRLFQGPVGNARRKPLAFVGITWVQSFLPKSSSIALHCRSLAVRNLRVCPRLLLSHPRPRFSPNFLAVRPRPHFLVFCFLPFSEFSTQFKFNPPSDPSSVFTTSRHTPLLINVLLEHESWFYISLCCVDNLSVSPTGLKVPEGRDFLCLSGTYPRHKSVFKQWIQMDFFPLIFYNSSFGSNIWFILPTCPVHLLNQTLNISSQLCISSFSLILLKKILKYSWFTMC